MFHSYMELAFEEAERAAQHGEVPVGAVIVKSNHVLARHGNRTITQNDPTAHAEILVIREACQAMQSQRLAECDLYVTLEPCALCAAAISFARIRRLYFSVHDEKSGAVDNGPCFFSHTTCHHKPEIYSGLSETRGRELLKQFFAKQR